MRSRLVADPVLIGMPERSSLKDDDSPAASCEALRQNRSASSGSDHNQIYLVIVSVASHGVFTGQITTSDIQEKPRFVVFGRSSTLEQICPHVPS